MNTLILLLLFIFAGVALMVVLGEKFAKPIESEKLQKISRWILPLVALSIIIQMFIYWMQ
jgi:cadmium resistance protein CadD (predicted permease)